MTPSLPRGYHSPQVDVEVRLNTNESPWAPPEEFRRRLADEVARTDFNRYPDREARGLREALATLHGVSPECVFATNGSNEAIALLLAVIGGPGRRAVMFTPTYTLHSHLSHLSATEVLATQRAADFVLDPVTVKEAATVDAPDIMFLCLPNNPTGTLDAPDVVDAALEGPALVLVDEAYGEFTDAPSAISRVGTANVAVVRTFSKAWAMAGLRLGYAVAPPEIVSAMVERGLPYHLDVVKQMAGRIALDFTDEMKERVSAIAAERERLSASLGELPVTTWPSAANFILFRPESPAGRVWERLIEHSVLVRDLSLHEGLENCLRVTVGTPAENDRFIDSLGEVLV